MKLLNDNISYLIDKNRLNQDEIADLLQVSRGMISSWIRSKASPKYDKLLLISEMFKISVDDLLKKDLSKMGNNIGLLGAENTITLDKPYSTDFLEEPKTSYITVEEEFKNKLSALILKDKDIANAIRYIVKEGIKVN